MSNTNKLKLFYFMQYLDPRFWQWAEGDPDAAQLVEYAQGEQHPASDEYAKAKAEALLRFLVDRLEQQTHLVNGKLVPVQVREAYAIVHDSDSAQDGSRQLPHVHGIVRFAERSMKLEQVAHVLGLAPQYVELPQAGGRAVAGRSSSQDNMLAYLVHAKDQHKFQYSPARVATVRGEDYATVYGVRVSHWKLGGMIKHGRPALDGVSSGYSDFSILGADKREKQFGNGVPDDPKSYGSKAQSRHLLELAETQLRAGMKAANEKILVRNIGVMITDGRIDLEDLTLHSPTLLSLHRATLQNFLDTRAAQVSLENAKKLHSGEFSKTNFFISGATGLGKTQLAKSLLGVLGEELRWSEHVAASTNCLDDYSGEVMLLLDDARQHGMNVDEWLKLFDPYNASPASARYHNKSVVAPRVIIQTGPSNPAEFFFYMKGRGRANEGLLLVWVTLCLACKLGMDERITCCGCSLFGGVQG